MEAIFKKTRWEYIRTMKEIEDEMLEAYAHEYGEMTRELHGRHALALLADCFVFVKEMIPYYQSTRKMLEQFLFVGKYKETRFMTEMIGKQGLGGDSLSGLDEWHLCKAVQYAARWAEYYYRLYEQARQPMKNTERIQGLMFKIDMMMQDASKKINDTAFGGEGPKQPEMRKKDVKFPIRLYHHLDEYVVGQDNVKKALSMAVHHFINYGERNNVLMIGPSGSGKNYVTQILSQFKELENKAAVYTFDASSLTPNGFQGASISDIFKGFSSECAGKGVSSRRGIIYLDEIDKVIYPNTDSHNENVNAIIQRQLLAAIEGTTVINGVDTSNILFILGGAFEELHDLEKERREKKRRPLGFAAAEEETELPGQSSSLKEDLMSLGAQKEFLGRIPVVVRMERLGKEELKKILLHGKTGVIRIKQELFARDGLELVVEEEVYDLLVEKMYEENLGARSARNIIENLLGNYNFDMLLEGYVKMTVHAGMITRGEKPYFEKKKKKAREEKGGKQYGRVERIAV